MLAMSMPTHCVLLLDLGKNEQNLMEKLSKVRSNFYFFSKKEKKNCSRGIVHS